jgi:transcriptional regulator with XRE-family HTH domain
MATLIHESSDPLSGLGRHIAPRPQPLDQSAVVDREVAEAISADPVRDEVGFDFFKEAHTPFSHAEACGVKSSLERACFRIKLRYELRMGINGWRERLADAIDKDGRSLSAICRSANVGQNVLTQLFNDGKVPKITTFMALCRELRVSPLYILEGVNVDVDDVELLKVWAAASPERRRAFLAILQAE